MAKISQSEGLLRFELVSLKLSLKLNWEVRMMKVYKELNYRYALSNSIAPGIVHLRNVHG